MPPKPAVLAAVAALALSGPALLDPVLAQGLRGSPTGVGSAPHHRRYGPARPLAPEVRYRDPRYRPTPRHAGPPPALIQAYLSRLTEAPIYNEPPSRFPQR